jgi:SAM-dependent methyltransferase
MTGTTALPAGMEHAHCPVCGGEGEFVRWQRDLQLGAPGEFGQRCCNSCELFFLSPRPEVTAMWRHYPKDYQPYQNELTQPLPFGLSAIRAYARRRRKVLRFVKGGRILDVGCGNGAFLDSLGSRDWQRHAMDLEQHCQFTEPVPFFAGRFDCDRPPLENLDAVTLWHVFEHLYDPRQALRHAHAILRPGGLLFLAIPAMHSLDRHVFGPGWIGWDVPRHLATYSDKAMTTLFRAADLKLEAVMPDACNGAMVALSLEFALRSRQFETAVGRSLIVHAILTPWAELSSLVGWASARIYVARK